MSTIFSDYESARRTLLLEPLLNDPALDHIEDEDLKLATIAATYDLTAITEKVIRHDSGCGWTSALTCDLHDYPVNCCIHASEQFWDIVAEHSHEVIA